MTYTHLTPVSYTHLDVYKRQVLIVEKNSLIGKVLVIRMILIFISQTQERLSLIHI
ncbi:integrase [Enterococcus faecium]|nr:integrase [Enterococcus faecium]